MFKVSSGSSYYEYNFRNKSKPLCANWYDIIKVEELAVLKCCFKVTLDLSLPSTISLVCRDTPFWDNSILHINRC